MDVEEVKRRVAEIAEAAGDDEAAHTMEDNLYRHVLQSIADGTCEDHAGCAEAALKTRDLNFSRWCA